ncbi:MAG: SAM-dependent chlorinase/fluorinase [Elusimicrobiales bacterium]|nr:SAM-dependent chlorinase/fluorinase [Elusimicrobiales bacterium]
MKTKFISLITDFGSSDPFVGIMKSVIYSKNSSVNIIDITHSIPPQDIRTAAFYMMASITYLPKSAMMLCVVDPGVGTGRSVIWVKTENHQIIAPDNGLISWVEEKEKIIEARVIDNQKLFLPKISSTFHGRDIMAPAAAIIAKGFKEDEIGTTYDSYNKIPFPHPLRVGNTVYGEVIAIDRFGNAITNIMKDYVTPKSIFNISNILIKGLTLTYALGGQSEEIAVIGSYDFVEFSIKNSNFSKTHNIKIGDKVEVIVAI